ncbi:MAG TPA: hypothetical protein PLQ76_07690, partial [bacterium]|nr:hypothetical protein [bacterium]
QCGESNSSCPSDCYCEDGICDPSEVESCTIDCPVCGDGAYGSGESCDDGANNGTNGYCNATCNGYVGCGNGTTEGTETCDAGTSNGCGTSECGYCPLGCRYLP